MIKINDLPTSSAVTDSHNIVIDNGSTTEKLNYATLARAIVEQFTTTLAGVTQSVQSAIGSLNDSITLLSKTLVGWIGAMSEKNIDNFPTSNQYGTFWLNNFDSTIAGTKPLTNGYGVLFTLRQSATIARQMYIDSSGRVYARYYTFTTGVWTAWTASA